MAEIIKKAEIRERKESEDSENDFEPQFQPIVTLPEVEICTNEENEIVLLKMRAKLYRFDTSSDPSEWKERGTGEMKILQHKENNSVRIVMRRDKTFKVCANHFITPWMVLKNCVGSEKAFVYTVPADFADELAKSECLAIKFANVEHANLFKEKFEEGKEIVKTKCCLYNGEDGGDSEEDESAEEVREKLSGLDVSKNEEDKENDNN